MSTTELTPELIAAFERRAERGRRDEIASLMATARSASAEAGQELDGAIDPPSPHRRRAVLVAVAAVVALIVGTTVVLTFRDPPIDTVNTPAPPPTISGAWRELTRVRAKPVGGWPLTGLLAGRRLVLPGAASAAGGLGRTASFDLDGGGIVELNPPADGLLSSREGQPSVWTGQEVVVFGLVPRSSTPDREGTPAAWALDPATGTWRALAPPPHITSVAFWTGSEILAVSSEGAVDSWDPATDRWTTRTVPDPPFFIERTTAVWTGSEVIATSRAQSTDRTMARFSIAGGRWEPMPNPPLEPLSLIWNGTVVLAFDGITGRLAAFDPATGTWAERAEVAEPHRWSMAITAAVDGRLVVLGGERPSPDLRSVPTTDGMVWDPATDSWAALPPLPEGVTGYGVAVSDGDRLLLVARADAARTLVVLGLDFDTSTGPAPTTGGPGTMPAGLGTGPDIEIPPIADAPHAHLFVGNVPEGFEADPGRLQPQSFRDPRAPLPRWLTVSLVRMTVTPALLDAWRAKDSTRILAAMSPSFGSLPDERTTVETIGGRPVVVQSETLEGYAPNVADRHDRFVILVTGPDSTVQISTTNLTDDELDAVVRGLRVEVG